MPAKTEDTPLRLTLRVAADMLCLWHLCGNSICQRRRTCRGDVSLCSGRMSDWFEAVRRAAKERQSFEAMEEQLEGAKLAALRRFKECVTGTGGKKP